MLGEFADYDDDAVGDLDYEAVRRQIETASEGEENAGGRGVNTSVQTAVALNRRLTQKRRASELAVSLSGDAQTDGDAVEKSNVKLKVKVNDGLVELDVPFPDSEGSSRGIAVVKSRRNKSRFESDEPLLRK